MSAIEYITRGGTATYAGNLSLQDRSESKGFMKKFGEFVTKTAKELQIPASEISIYKMNYLMIAKDTSDYHFVFADKSGSNHVNYSDLTSYGRVSTEQLLHQIRIEVGEVDWALTVPIPIVNEMSDLKIAEFATQYINAISAKKKSEKLSDDAIVVPELTKEIEAFNLDFKGKKTAFIIMQFSKTKAHVKIVTTIKETLAKHQIIGLRADDKEYADDLFSNIKTYMHCCDFGIGVFERIVEDNFNPNVSIEVGYMMGLRKNVSLLKDQTLKNLPTDLMGKLYKQFDPQDIENTLPEQLEKWMKDKGIIK